MPRHGSKPPIQSDKRQTFLSSIIRAERSDACQGDHEESKNDGR